MKRDGSANFSTTRVALVRSCQCERLAGMRRGLREGNRLAYSGGPATGRIDAQFKDASRNRSLPREASKILGISFETSFLDARWEIILGDKKYMLGWEPYMIWHCFVFFLRSLTYFAHWE
jgi:hypothetical protein